LQPNHQVPILSRGEALVSVFPYAIATLLHNGTRRLLGAPYYLKILTLRRQQQRTANWFRMTTPYHARYFAHELTRQYGPGDGDRLSMALFDACVDLNPHQIDARTYRQAQASGNPNPFSTDRVVVLWRNIDQMDNDALTSGSKSKTTTPVRWSTTCSTSTGTQPREPSPPGSNLEGPADRGGIQTPHV
jgi:hypothetical protein